jgi:hypothetical protein
MVIIVLGETRFVLSDTKVQANRSGSYRNGMSSIGVTLS